MSGLKTDQLLEVLRLQDLGLSTPEIAARLSVHKRTVQRRLVRARRLGLEPPPKKGGAGTHPAHSIVLPEIQRWDRPRKNEDQPSGLHYEEPDDQIPIEELLEQRKDRFEQTAARKKARKIRQVDVKARGPIAICHFGDPHIDDDGCDIPELLKCVEVVSRTPCMWGGNIGDTTNNWVGRLEKLYKKQTTTLDDAVRLAEWLLRSVPWLYMVLGNHDHWNQGSHLLKMICQDADIRVLVDHTARIEFQFPRGAPLRIVCRHDFRGSSIWNRAHGPLRESKLNPWGDVYISGHRHIWVHHTEEGMDGIPRHAIVVRGFKFHDTYADSQGYYEHQHGQTVTTILDPLAKSPMERVRVVWDVEEAADLLGWLRRRAGLGSGK